MLVLITHNSNTKQILVKEETRVFPTTFKYRNKSYTKHSTNTSNTKAFYDCKHTKTCKAHIHLTWSDSRGDEVIVDIRLVLDPLTGVKNKDPHTCEGIKGAETGIVDVTEEIRHYIQEKTVQWSLEQGKSRVIARETLDLFKDKHAGKAIVGLDENQIYHMIRKNQQNEIGRDWNTRIKEHPMGSTEEDDIRRFLLYDGDIAIPLPCGGRRRHRIIIWAHPDLLFQLRNGAVHIFIDGTFDCVPHGFTQCLILMAYLPGYKIYVPIFYILLDSKLQDCYIMVFQRIKEVCGEDGLRALTVTGGTFGDRNRFAVRV